MKQCFFIKLPGFRLPFPPMKHLLAHLLVLTTIKNIVGNGAFGCHKQMHHILQ